MMLQSREQRTILYMSIESTVLHSHVLHWDCILIPRV